jgi:hypothetical protein
MRIALHGSPFGFIDGDTVRLSAMAERYTTTWRSADGIVSALPSEYPPLYPWLIGHISVLLHVPAWRLLAPAGEITSSATIVAGPSSTNSPRSRSLTRICHGAPGVSCSPAMNPALHPAKDGRGGDSELLGGVADREQLAVRVIGRLMSGDSAVAAQAAADDLGEALTDRGAAALAVEDPSDGGVVVAGGEPGEQRDRVLVGADR